MFTNPDGYIVRNYVHIAFSQFGYVSNSWNEYPE